MKSPKENSTKNSAENPPQRTITRREFVGGALATGALATGAIVAGAPALLRGRNLNEGVLNPQGELVVHVQNWMRTMEKSSSSGPSP